MTFIYKLTPKRLRDNIKDPKDQYIRHGDGGDGEAHVCQKNEILAKRSPVLSVTVTWLQSFVVYV